MPRRDNFLMLSRAKSGFKGCCNCCISCLIDCLSDCLSDYVMNRSGIVACREAAYSAVKPGMEIWLLYAMVIERMAQ